MTNPFIVNPLKMKSHFNLRVINYKTVKLSLKNRKIYLIDKSIFESTEKMLRQFNIIHRNKYHNLLIIS